MPLLARRLREVKCPEIHLLYGARTANELAWADRVEAEGAQIHTATDDGSAGHHGVCTALLPPLLNAPGEQPAICACGPEPMLRAVRSLALERGVEAQLSLEEHMACGFGVCLGCVVPVRGAENEYGRFRRCCVEGPVFTAEELDW